MLITDDAVRETVQAAVSKEQPDPGMWERVRDAALSRPHRTSGVRHWSLVGVAAVAVLLLAVMIPSFWPGRDIVLAMEQAVANLHAFHGVIERNSDHQRIEIWWDGDHYKMVAPRMQQISNGEWKWLVLPDQQAVFRRVPVESVAETGFDLRAQVTWAKRYPHQVVGEESVLGRPATKLVGKFSDDRPFAIWVDKETSLPIKYEETKQNGVVETNQYVQFELNPQFPAGFFDYQAPAGWQYTTDQVPMPTLADAAAQVGFTPITIQEKPLRIIVERDQKRILLDYGDTKVWQLKLDMPFTVFAEDDVTVGKANGGPAMFSHTFDNQASWSQNGLMVMVAGDRWLEIGRQIAPDLTPPDKSLDLVANAEVKLPVDLAAAQDLQQRADRGQLSKEQVLPHRQMADLARTYLREQGVDVSKWRLPHMSAATGSQAVLEIAEGPYQRLYLQRLVRSDYSGLWFVVGYDKRS